MKKTLFAAAAAVMMLAAAGAADEKALSSAQEIARHDTTKSSGNALHGDGGSCGAEEPLSAPRGGLEGAAAIW